MTPKVVIYSNDFETRNLIDLTVQKILGAPPVIVDPADLSYQLNLDPNSNHLIFTDNTASGLKILGSLTELPIKNTLYVLVNPEDKVLPPFKAYNPVGISKLSLPEDLIHYVKSFLKEDEISTPEEFCKISTETLLRVNPVLADIYIRLSDQKYIKLFKAGTTFSEEDLKKLNQKMRSLYILASQAEGLVMKFKRDLEKQFVKLESQSPELADAISDSQDLAKSIYSKLGFNAEVASLVTENVSATIKLVGTSPRLLKALSHSKLRSKSYVSRHSVVLANLSCSIASMMEMNSQQTFHKLVLASLFHDFAFESEDLNEKTEGLKLSDLKNICEASDLATVLAHPLKAAEVLRQMSEIPGEVEFLVFQHHERPDGEGFPKGLRSHQIVALSAVFIYAHHVLNEMSKDPENFSLIDFVKSTADLYDSGTFKKIREKLKEVLKEKKSKAA